MSAPDVWSGSFISYFKKNQRRIFPKHNDKTFISIIVVILDNPWWEIISQGTSPYIIFKFGLYAATDTISSYFVQSTYDTFISCPEYMWNSKVKILCLGTFSETSRRISVFPPLTCLSYCVINWAMRMKGTHLIIIICYILAYICVICALYMHIHDSNAEINISNNRPSIFHVDALYSKA